MNPRECDVTLQQLTQLLDEFEQHEATDLQHPLRLHIQQCDRCQQRLDDLVNATALEAYRPKTQEIDQPRLDDEQVQQLLDAIDSTIGPAQSDIPPEIGAYTVCDEIGRGGMGVVFRGFDRRLRREVALKMLLPQRPSMQLRARFVREGRAMAALHDQGIVPILEVIDHPHHPALVMPMMQGGSLAARVRANDYSITDAITWTRHIAEALVTVHRFGYVHRDIKPGNVLLDQQGRAYLGDFGLVRWTNEVQLTAADCAPGTPEYLPPELIADVKASSTQQSDLYQLGVLLYELLVGRPPFIGQVPALLSAIAAGQPVSPRTQRPGISRDLETVCLKALAVRPADRYASALEFAADLHNVLAQRPVLARPVSRWRRLGRFLYAHRWQAVLVTASVLMVALFLADSWRSRGTAQQLTKKVEQALGQQKAAEIERDSSRDMTIMASLRAQVAPNINPAQEELAKNFLDQLIKPLNTHLEAAMARNDPPEQIALVAQGLAGMNLQRGSHAEVVRLTTLAIERMEKLVADRNHPKFAILMNQMVAAQRMKTLAFIELGQARDVIIQRERYRTALAQWEKLLPADSAHQVERVTEVVIDVRLARNEPSYQQQLKQAVERFNTLRRKVNVLVASQGYLRQLAAMLLKECEHAQLADEVDQLRKFLDPKPAINPKAI